MKSRRLCHILLASVSALSISTVAPAVTQAQDTGSWVSIEGSLLKRNGENFTNYFYDNSANPDVGSSFALRYGTTLQQPGLSLSAGVRRTSTGTADFYSGYYGPYSEIEASSVSESITTLDLDIGRDIGIGGFNGRVFVGARAANLNQSGESYHYYGGFFADERLDVETEAKFQGMGPRIGIEGEMPLNDNVNLELGAAGALLFGTRTVSAQGYYYGGFGPAGPIDESLSESQNVLNVEANAGLSMPVGDGAKLSAGVRGEIFKQVGGGASSSDPIKYYGAYLKFTKNF